MSAPSRVSRQSSPATPRALGALLGSLLLLYTAEDSLAKPAPKIGEYSLIESLPQLTKQANQLTRTYLDPALRSRENRFAIKLTEGRVKYLSEDYRSAAQVLLELTDTYEKKGDLLYREALFYLADSLYHIGNITSAAERFQELLSLGQSSARVCALGRLLEIAVALKQPKLAERYQAEALREIERSPDPHVSYQLGKYSFEQGRYTEAQRLWGQLGTEVSLYPQARYFIAVADLKLGQLNEALRHFDELRSLNIEALRAQRSLRPSEELTLGERHEQVLKMSRQQDPGKLQCVFRSRQEQEADVKGWDHVVAEASLAVARIYYELGRFDDSTSAYLEVPRGSASFRKAIEESVWVAIRQGLYKEALQRLDIQLIDEPDMLNNPNTRLLQGRLMSTLGRFEDARSLFQEIRHRFELLKARDIAPILREAKGQLAQHFQRLIQGGNQALNLESLIPRSARGFIKREASTSAARSLFVELSALRRDIELAKKDIKLLKWVLEAPNRTELFPQLHKGLLKSIELRSLLFTVQRQLNERQSRGLSDPELKALRARVTAAQTALEGVPVSALKFQELEHQVESQLLKSDLTLSETKLTLRNLDSQLAALKIYLRDLRTDEVGKILNLRERSALIKKVEQEEERTTALKELAQRVRDQLRKTQLRVGLYDEAFQVDERLRQRYFKALKEESEWLVKRRHLDSALLSQVTRLHSVILDFQERSLKLTDKNTGDLSEQLLAEERNVAQQERQLQTLTRRAQGLAGQITARSFNQALQVIDSYLLESDAGLLDVTWSQKSQRSELLGEEHKRRRVHLKVIQRDLVDAPL